MTTIKSILRQLGAPVRGGVAGREIEEELRYLISVIRNGLANSSNLGG